ncbi:MAG: hypothetical protein NT096_02140 [Proteobacteria bacterium]|nr:hypothetical protein [Pseudomonadota bacterium]
MEKRLSKKQMKHLRESYQFKSDEELAKEWQTDSDTIQKALKTMGLRRTKAEQKQVVRIAEADARREIRVEAGREWLWTLLSVFSIIILGAIVYSNTLNASWHFDDSVVVTENWGLRDLRGNFNTIFSANRSVGFFTFALNYYFNKLNVTGYHVVNIFIHIANALFVYSLIMLTLKTPAMVKSRLANHARFLALASGLIFVSHPIQTQAVTYIAQRFTSLATFFYLLSLLLFVKARLTFLQGKSFFSPLHCICYCFSLLSAFLAMHTKEITFTLPFIIILYELFFIDSTLKSWGKRFLYLLPFILMLAIIPSTALKLSAGDKPIGDIIGEIREQVQETPLISRGDYLLTQFNVIVTYIRLLLLPMNQNLDYDYPIARKLFQFPTFLSFMFLLALFIVAIYLFFKKRRLISFAILWFFITLSVESSIIPIRDVIYEHRVYLPSVGFVILIAIFLHESGESFRQRFLQKPPVEKKQ